MLVLFYRSTDEPFCINIDNTNDIVSLGYNLGSCLFTWKEKSCVAFLFYFLFFYRIDVNSFVS